MGNDSSKKKTSGELTDKEIAVLKANYQLSEQQIREMYKEFKLECPTGKMNKKQYRELFKKVAGSTGNSDMLADNAFAAFDVNHDGVLDFTDFVLSSTVGNKKDPDSKLELAFSMLDTSGDGHISFKEMSKFMEKGLDLMGPCKTNRAQSGELAEAIFEMFGVDKAQKLSKKQFIDGCKNNKDLADMF